MRFVSISMAYVLVAGALAVAQDAPKADLFLGYSFLRANSARDIPAFTNNGGLVRSRGTSTHTSRWKRNSAATTMATSITLSSTPPK